MSATACIRRRRLERARHELAHDNPPSIEALPAGITGRLLLRHNVKRHSEKLL